MAVGNRPPPPARSVPLVKGESPVLLTPEEEAKARAWGRRAAFYVIAASLLITFGPLGLLYLWSCS